MKVGGETKALVDRQIGLDIEWRSARARLFRENVTTSSGQRTADTTHRLPGNLDLGKVDEFQKAGLSEQPGCVQRAVGIICPPPW